MKLSKSTCSLLQLFADCQKKKSNEKYNLRQSVLYECFILDPRPLFGKGRIRLLQQLVVREQYFNVTIQRIFFCTKIVNQKILKLTQHSFRKNPNNRLNDEKLCFLVFPPKRTKGHFLLDGTR